MLYILFGKLSFFDYKIITFIIQQCQFDSHSVVSSTKLLGSHLHSTRIIPVAAGLPLHPLSFLQTTALNFSSQIFMTTAFLTHRLCVGNGGLVAVLRKAFTLAAHLEEFWGLASR